MTDNPEPSPPTPDHRLSLVVHGTWLKAEIVCHEPVGAYCRQECADPQCLDERRPPHPPCNDGREPCPVRDMGECHEALWLNEDDLLETHTSALREPISDGMRITIDWDGNGYVWRGAETST